MTRPVDGMAVALFGRTPAQAIARDECIRCGRFIAWQELSPEDDAEYHISAMCPDCYAWVMAEEPA